MAFYNDLDGRSRKEKQIQAEARGGFDDEGSRYTGNRGKSGGSSHSGKPAGQGGYNNRGARPAGQGGYDNRGARPAGQGGYNNRGARPAGQGGYENRGARPAGQGGYDNRGARPAGQGGYDNRGARPAGQGGYENRGARPAGQGGYENRGARPAGQGGYNNRGARPAGQGGYDNRGARPAGQGGYDNRGARPAGQGGYENRGARPAGQGGYDNRGARPAGQGGYENRGARPAPRPDARPRYHEDERPVSYRDRPRTAPEGERTFNRAPRDFSKSTNYRFSNTAPIRHNERGAGVTPPSYDEQRRARTQEEPRYNSYRYAAPVATPVAAPIAEPVESELIPNENLLSGRNPIREALKSGRDIEKLLVARGELSGSAREIVQIAHERHIPVQEVERTRLDAITHNHQGMLAFASAYQYSSLEAMLALAEERNEAPFLILLDGITDPHNLGAVIRTAECAGAHGVIVQERRAVGLTPAAVKASAGAIEHVPVARVTNLSSTIDALKAKNIWVYAADMSGEDYAATDFNGAVALVIGAEGEGVGRRVLETCDKAVSIPLKGKLDSLNASVAAGILMYAVMRAR